MPTPYSLSVVTPQHRTTISPRIDYQLSANHTLTLRYSYNRDIVRNAGAGGLNLVSRGYHNNALSQTVQLTETAVIGTDDYFFHGDSSCYMIWLTFATASLMIAIEIPSFWRMPLENVLTRCSKAFSWSETRRMTW